MSVSQEISAQIPYLRRFARALTGSQNGGDAYVLATLEAIVGDARAFNANNTLPHFSHALGIHAGQRACGPQYSDP